MKANLLYVATTALLVHLFFDTDSIQAQVTSVLGKVESISPRGITILPGKAPNGAKPVFIGASSQTQVRLNVLAKPERIRRGAYVQMRVLWDGKSALKASSIKFPDGRPSKFGLFKG